MTAAGPEERERDSEPYAGPPPTLAPSPELRAPVTTPEEVAGTGVPEPAGPTPFLLAMRDAGWAWWRPLT
ncbi:MAG: hypothetical protein AVDCRST_MAG48-160, partial [uncultured Friedmanniella sp.]